MTVYLAKMSICDYVGLIATFSDTLLDESSIEQVSSGFALPKTSPRIKGTKVAPSDAAHRWTQTVDTNEYNGNTNYDIKSCAKSEIGISNDSGMCLIRAIYQGQFRFS